MRRTITHIEWATGRFSGRTFIRLGLFTRALHRRPCVPDREVSTRGAGI